MVHLMTLSLASSPPTGGRLAWELKTQKRHYMLASTKQPTSINSAEHESGRAKMCCFRE